mgnify:CR=1 FL=1
MSNTFTVLTTGAAALPAASLTSYVTEYEPAVFVSTVLVAVILAEISPSKLSVAVAPESV